MALIDHPALMDVLRHSDKVVYVFGAGMSIALDRNSPSWERWLDSGAALLRLSDQQVYRDTLHRTVKDPLVAAAQVLLDMLKREGLYGDFMRRSLTDLHPEQPDLQDSVRLIVRAGDTVATTNYDQLLEQCADVGYVTYSQPAQVLQVMNGALPPHVVHLHGIYDPDNGMDDIVAGNEQYDAVIANKGAQFLQNLMSTYPVIFVGCGATVSDPNLSGFITFAAQQLQLDVPYFYICRQGDSLPDLPDNVQAVPYGSAYDELPLFLHELASYRVRYRDLFRDIVQIDPYTPARTVTAPFARLHFTNGFHPFVGRTAELSQLDAFLQDPADALWWTVSGEGGIGKSRLLLEWLRRLPATWYGFFGKSNDKTELYKSIRPFANTVVVLDYVLGREKECGAIVQTLLHRYERSSYKLRIVFLERRFDSGAKDGWFFHMTDKMEAADRIRFLDAAYHSDRGRITALHLTALSMAEKEDYITSYLTAFLTAFGDTARLPITRDVAEQIVASFDESVGRDHDRPLYLSIFAEMWVYREGQTRVHSVEELLTLYLDREEARWLHSLNDSEPLLCDYLRLLPLSAAIETACINSGENDYLEEPSLRLYHYLQGTKRPGRHIDQWPELFLWEEVPRPREEDEEDTTPLPEKWMLFSPLYPDILRAFIVAHYVDDTDLERFTLLARSQSTLEFAIFLGRAMDDFPEMDCFREMALIAPTNEGERFEYCLTLLQAIETLMPYRARIEADLIASTIRDEVLLPYELEVWRRIAILLEDAKESVHDSAENFLVYLSTRLAWQKVRDFLPELINGYEIGFYNQKEIRPLESFLERMEALTEPWNDDRIATACAEGRERLSELRELFENSAHIRRDWEAVSQLMDKFPGDIDILSALVQIAYRYVHAITGQDMSVRIYRVAHKLWEATTRVDMAGQDAAAVEEIFTKTAYCLADTYFDYHRAHLLRTTDGDEESFCWESIRRLHERYPDMMGVTKAYAMVASSHRMDIRGPQEVTEEDCASFKDWFQRYPDEIDFAESYADMLFLRYAYLMRTNKPRKAQKCLRELKRVARKANYSDYHEDNKIFHMIDMLT